MKPKWPQLMKIIDSLLTLAQAQLKAKPSEVPCTKDDSSNYDCG